MFLYKYLSFSIISLTLITVESQDIISNLIDEVIPQNLQESEILDALVTEKVEIRLYYESLCWGCRDFDTTKLEPTVKKLASNLDLKVYPYGRAKTIDNGDGTFDFICKHGPEECYGNMLHACAIDVLGNITKGFFFNACMMDGSQNGKGSDDEAADKCGNSLGVDSEAIKQCAKGPRGTALFKYYGDETKKVGIKHVPHVLINGVKNDMQNFMEDVCAAFKTPPPACK